MMLARQARDFAAFVPALKRNIDLKREEAACLADGGDLYDALLDQFEPGATTAEIGPLLEGMRPRLAALRAKIAVLKAVEYFFHAARNLGTGTDRFHMGERRSLTRFQ